MRGERTGYAELWAGVTRRRLTLEAQGCAQGKKTSAPQRKEHTDNTQLRYGRLPGFAWRCRAAGQGVSIFCGNFGMCVRRLSFPFPAVVVSFSLFLTVLLAKSCCPSTAYSYAARVCIVNGHAAPFCLQATFPSPSCQPRPPHQLMGPAIA